MSPITKSLFSRALVAFLLFGAGPAHAELGTGDIAIVAFNADGDDDFAIVALAEIFGETIYFTDKATDAIGGSSDNDVRRHHGRGAADPGSSE